MESATLTSRTLKIDGMNGDACVQKVTTALKGVPNVKTGSVKVGEATIHADKAGCDAACNAINTAGYKSHPATDANQVAGQGAGKDAKSGASQTETKPAANAQGSQQQGQGAGRNAGDHNNAKPTIANAGSAAKATETKAEPVAGKHN